MSVTHVNYDGLSALAASAAGLAAAAGSEYGPHPSSHPFSLRRPGTSTILTKTRTNTVDFVRENLTFGAGGGYGGLLWEPLVERTAELSTQLQVRIGELGDVTAAASSQLQTIIGAYQHYDDLEAVNLRKVFPDHDFLHPHRGPSVNESAHVTLTAPTKIASKSVGTDYADVVLGGWMSASGLIMKIVELITHTDPREPVKKHFGGDWDNTDDVADVLDTIAVWFGDYGAAMKQAGDATAEDWKGPAGEACRTWFAGIRGELQPVGDGVKDLADRYRAFGEAMKTQGAIAADLLQRLMDELVVLGTTVALSSLAGGSAGASAAIAANAPRVARIKEIVVGIDAVINAVKALASSLDNLTAAIDIIEGQQPLTRKMPTGLFLPAGG